MKKIALALACVMFVMVNTTAQVTPTSHMEKLSRGLMAMPAQDGGIFVSWRMLGTDNAPATTFDLLRNGEVIAANIRNKTNFVDRSGNQASDYQVVTKVNGKVTETSETVTPWSENYKVMQLDRPDGGVDDVTGEHYSYTPNDCSTGDVDGDGDYELIVQWQPSNKTDNSNEKRHPGKEYIDCYRLNGELLWRIDMGINMLAGDQHTQFLVYDFDCDGKSEIIMRTAPGSKDGMGQYVNQVADDPAIAAADNHHDWRAPGSAALTGGQEYLTVFEGATGKAIHTIYYNPNRDAGYGGAASGTKFNWGEGRNDYVATYGNRGNRFLATVAYLDGPNERPAAVMCRGYYTQSYLWAVDFDGKQLKHKWLHASLSRTKVEVTDANWAVSTRTYKSNTFGTSDCYTAYGQGNHNISVADVDDDGCDEIIYGAATIDNDGWLMYSTGLWHGDAMHVADIIPSRPGYEVLRCCESAPYGIALYDARTGEKIFHQTAGGDTGRALAADIMPEYEGLEFWGAKGNSPRESTSGGFATVTSTLPSINFRIYWDGDLQDELFDGSLDTGTGIAHPNIMKWDGTTFTKTQIGYNGSQTCNWTKATPCLQADIIGDWREELFMWNFNDPSQLNIVASNIPSEYRVPTLMHDHNYRLSIAWQNVSYNQPPHLGYYLPAKDFTTISYNFKNWPNENVQLATGDKVGTAWEIGNGKYQDVYQCTTEGMERFAFQGVTNDLSGKGYWFRPGYGLTCINATRSMAILDLSEGDVVTIHTTGGFIDFTGGGNGDGTWSVKAISGGYVVTMLSDGNLGMCFDRSGTSAQPTRYYITSIVIEPNAADPNAPTMKKTVWDFADLCKRLGNNKKTMTYDEKTIKIGKIECNYGTGEYKGLAMQGAGSWFLYSTNGLYQGNGGGRTIGVLDLKAGQIVTFVTSSSDINGVTGSCLNIADATTASLLSIETTDNKSTYTYVMDTDGILALDMTRYYTLFSINVEEAPELTLTLTDGTDLTASGVYSSATYTREIAADTYGTICLPFAPDAETLENYSFFRLESEEEGALNFVEEATPAANTPYLYCLKEDKEATAITGGVTTVSSTMNDIVAGDWTMKGSFTNQTIATAEADTKYYGYAPANNQVVKANKTLTILPYRAYFTAPKNAANVRVRITRGDETTAIDNAQFTIDNTQLIYDLQGRRVESMTKGIYIVNGKKVVVE